MFPLIVVAILEKEPYWKQEFNAANCKMYIGTPQIDARQYLHGIIEHCDYVRFGDFIEFCFSHRLQRRLNFQNQTRNSKVIYVSLEARGRYVHNGR